MEARLLAKRLGMKNPKLESKAGEYIRLANLRLSGTSLGQGELCKAHVCMELASMTLGVQLDAGLLIKCSGASEQVYKNTKAMLQRLLGVGSKVTPRELCIQHGCARVEQAVKAALAAYKERFVQALPPAQQGHVDFGRPVFLAAAFYLTARKNKLQVDKTRLLQPLGVTEKEFSEVQASMLDLIFDMVGVGKERRRRRAVGEEGGGGLLEVTRGRARADEEGSSSSEEEAEGPEEDGMVGGKGGKKRQRQREYEQWKEEVMKQPALKKTARPSEKALKQATLSFGAGGRLPSEALR